MRMPPAFRHVRGPLLLVAVLGVCGPVYGQSAADLTFKSELLDRVADDAPLPALWLNREEVLAFDKLVLHARQANPDVMHQSARRDLTFPNLFGEERARHRGQLVHVECKLRLLRRLDLPGTLQGIDDGLTELYEAWLLDRTADAFYCVVVSDLPPGLKPAEEIDRPVECDAYFFKRYRYETREHSTDGGNVQRLAPLLIGRTIRLKADAAAGSSLWAVPGAVLFGTLGIVGLSVAAGVAVVWWFRREDHRVRARLRPTPPPTFVPESIGDDQSAGPTSASAGPWEPFGSSPSEN
jgi:hypothetical protein